MKLHEKIYYCRKKAGLSQEALAEQLGVSRQSVSKWETGESQPETNKLSTIASIFNVSIDWLLSEDDVLKEEKNTNANTTENTSSSITVDNKPNLTEKILKCFAWLAGIYFFVMGLYETAIACYSIFMFKSATTTFSVAYIIPLVIGLAMLTVGITLIIILCRHSKKKKIKGKRR